MATLALSDADVQPGFALSRLFAALFGDGKAVSDADQDETRNRRDFILGMLDRNPDAFASEHDVQGMTHLFAGRF